MFDSCGRIVGLNSFIVHKLDLVVHVTTIKKNWYSNQKPRTSQSMQTKSSSKGGSSSREGGTTAYSLSTAKCASKGYTFKGSSTK